MHLIYIIWSQNYTDLPKGMLLFIIDIINHVTSQATLVIFGETSNNESHQRILGIIKITRNGLQQQSGLPHSWDGVNLTSTWNYLWKYLGVWNWLRIWCAHRVWENTWAVGSEWARDWVNGRESEWMNYELSNGGRRERVNQVRVSGNTQKSTQNGDFKKRTIVKYTLYAHPNTIF